MSYIHPFTIGNFSALTVCVSMVFDTTIAGASGVGSLTLPFASGPTVDWGDGVIDNLNTHIYGTPDSSQSVTILTSVSDWRFNNTGDKDKLISFNDPYGLVEISNSAMWHGCSNLQYWYQRNSKVTTTDAYRMFGSCSNLGPDLDLSSWSGNKIASFVEFFAACSSLTGTLNLNGLVTSYATDLARMLYGFPQASANIDMRSWDMQNVTTIDSFMYGAGSHTTVDMRGVNTGSIANWHQFARNNQNVVILGMDDLDMSSATNLSYVLNLCDAQIPTLNPSDWNIGNVTQASLAFRGYSSGVGLTTAIYDQTLINFEAQPHQPNVTWDFGNSKYTAGSPANTAKDNLVADGWTIIDGGAI